MTVETYGTAEIVFMPVCSECRKIIPGTVNCTYSTRLSIADSIRYGEYEITPTVCPWCGKRFTRISIPTNLLYSE